MKLPYSHPHLSPEMVEFLVFCQIDSDVEIYPTQYHQRGMFDLPPPSTQSRGARVTDFQNESKVIR
jgi:hypothetical protein